MTLFATGHMVCEALEVARMLVEKTAEEHQVTGGLGGAVAELLCSAYPVPLEMIGMPNCFGESGTPEELLEKYGMKAVNIAAAALRVIG